MSEQTAAQQTYWTWRLTEPEQYEAVKQRERERHAAARAAWREASIREWTDEGFTLMAGATLPELNLVRGIDKLHQLVEVGQWWGIADLLADKLWVSTMPVIDNGQKEPSIATVADNIRSAK